MSGWVSIRRLKAGFDRLSALTLLTAVASALRTPPSSMAISPKMAPGSACANDSSRPSAVSTDRRTAPADDEIDLAARVAARENHLARLEADLAHLVGDGAALGFIERSEKRCAAEKLDNRGLGNHVKALSARSPGDLA